MFTSEYVLYYKFIKVATFAPITAFHTVFFNQAN